MLKCPYNGWKECDWEHCAARMLVKDLSDGYHFMRVCAIAYGGGVPRRDEHAKE